MESEEYEQIPWSNLVAEAQPSADRRLYLVGGAVAVVVILIVAMRMFGSQPAPAAPLADSVDEQLVATTAAPVDPIESAPVTEPPAAVGAVTEADLMAVDAGGADEGLDVAKLVAEWFVTDFYTRDGSDQTLASLRAMTSESIASELPHLDTDAANAFVEWAKAFRVEDRGATVDVSVAYRSVHAVDGGYVRDPVEAVVITLATFDDRWTVQTLPKITDLP